MFSAPCSLFAPVQKFLGGQALHCEDGGNAGDGTKAGPVLGRHWPETPAPWKADLQTMRGLRMENRGWKDCGSVIREFSTPGALNRPIANVTQQFDITTSKVMHCDAKCNIDP